MGARNGGIGFAIAAYKDPEGAEKTQQEVNGYMLNGHMIRLTYCIPGQEPEAIFDRLRASVVSVLLCFVLQNVHI